MTVCRVGDCDNPAARDGLCWAHRKRLQRDQPLTTGISRRPASALERLTEAALAYAEADRDDDWERAKDNLRKSATAYAAKHVSEATREAMARLRARGIHVGRPRKLDPETALRLVSEMGGIREAAIALQVSVWTVRRALRQVQKGPLLHSPDGPGPRHD